MTGLVLERFAAERMGRFAWGESDCATIAAEWVALREGTDPRAGTSWRGLSGARRYIAERGGSLRSAVGLLLARPEIAPTLARPGDVALIDGTTGIGQALGICAGRHLLCVSESGPIAVEMSAAVCAWPIGWRPGMGQSGA